MTLPASGYGSTGLRAVASSIGSVGPDAFSHGKMSAFIAVIASTLVADIK